MRWMNPDGTPNGERLDKLEALVKQTAANLLELRERLPVAFAEVMCSAPNFENPLKNPEADTPKPEIPKIPRRRRQRPRRSQ